MFIVLIDVFKIKLMKVYLKKKALYQRNERKKEIVESKNRLNDIKIELQKNSIERMKIKKNYNQMRK